MFRDLSKQQGRTLLSGLVQFSMRPTSRSAHFFLDFGLALVDFLAVFFVVFLAAIRNAPSTTLVDVWGWPLESDVLGDSRVVDAVTAVNVRPTSSPAPVSLIPGCKALAGELGDLR